MKSYPSMAKSIDEELNRYDKEYDQKHPSVRRAFIQVFPAHARAEIEDMIKETKERLANIAASYALSMALLNSPSPKNPLSTPHGIAGRRPPDSKGLDRLAKSIQTSIEHYSSAKMDDALLRPLIGDMFRTSRTSKAIKRLTKDPDSALLKAVHDLILQHWEIDKSFFETIPRPKLGQGTDMSFWESFLEYGVLCWRLRIADAQPRETVELEPKLIGVLKRRGKEPQDFFEAGPVVQETWIAEARGEQDGLRAVIDYAVERIRAQEKARKDSSRGGKAQKIREAIFQAITEKLRSNPHQTANKLWNSFPDTEVESLAMDVDQTAYVLYRSGEKLVQVCHSAGPKAYKEKEITRSTFEKYVTDARKKLKK